MRFKLRTAFAVSLWALFATTMITGAEASASEPSAEIVGSVLARPAVPSPVSAVDGMVAWAAPSGRGRRFEIVVRYGGHDRWLGATSAVGRIGNVKLGTDANGRTIVVYSHCPKRIPGSSIEGAGCRLWWAHVAGGAAHLIRAAPRGTSLGVAVEGILTFVKEGRPSRLETASLSGSAAHALPSPPHVIGGSITDISATSTGVAFIEASEEPGTSDRGLSQIWFAEGGGTPRLIAQVSGYTEEIDDAYEFFVGLTLSSEFIYTFLYAAPGLTYEAPPGITTVIPGLRRLTVTAPSVTTVSLDNLSLQDSRIGVEGLSYDPSDETLVASLIPVITYYPGKRCSTSSSSENACPVEVFAPVSFPAASG